MKKLLVGLLFFSILSCGKKDNNQPNGGDDHNGQSENSETASSGENSSGDEWQTITYVESEADFQNPERGFYLTSTGYASNFAPLTYDEVATMREDGFTGVDGYTFYPTLVLRSYVLDEFKDGPISEDYLNKMEQDFKAARDGGIKLILLYSYIYRELPDEVGDAPKDIVLGHIEQLKPYWQANKDVIMVVQEGFIGTWGEGGGSDYFGMPEWDNNVPLTEENWEDRNAVLGAILDAVPEDRMVQVRYPTAKQRFVYGPSATIDNAPALTESEAFSGSDKSRIAHHNNCFLANAHDAGTYFDEGNGATAPDYSLDEETVDILRDYTAEDSKYVVMGGETCNDAFPEFYNCEVAIEEMKEYHWTYLCADYHEGVLGSWIEDGCMDDASKNLGYRFVLNEFTTNKILLPGSKMSISLKLTNVGNTSPANPRPVQIVLVESTSGERTFLDMNADIRKWFTGDVEIEEELDVPSDIAQGTYKVYLNLPDASESISTRSEYSIRLANEEVWNDQTGFNNLLTEVKVAPNDR